MRVAPFLTPPVVRGTRGCLRSPRCLDRRGRQAAIYGITLRGAKMSYVGQTLIPKRGIHNPTQAIMRRWSKHRIDAANGSMAKFHRAISDHGNSLDTWRIVRLETVPGLEADDREGYWIGKLGTMQNGYNEKRSGNPDSKWRHVRISLHQAVLNNERKNVQLLIGKGADVNAKDEDGWTSLDWAIWQEHTDMQSLLLRHGGLKNAFPAALCGFEFGGWLPNSG